jgi:hypothetical protein
MTPDTDKPTCGKWMPRAKVYCARTPGHAPSCASPARMAGWRERDAVRRTIRVQTPEAHKRWNVAYRLSRYGITRKQFDWLLEVQGYACAMCPAPFTEDTVICVDHDHACCPDARRSCGKCVRGLLCRDCNTALGHIERKLNLADPYLSAPPGKLLPAI